MHLLSILYMSGRKEACFLYKYMNIKMSFRIKALDQVCERLQVNSSHCVTQPEVN